MSSRSGEASRELLRLLYFYFTNGSITIVIRARFDYDSATTRYEMRTIRLRLDFRVQGKGRVSAWCNGNVVGRINEVTLHWARLVLGRVTVFGGHATSHVTNPPR